MPVQKKSISIATSEFKKDIRELEENLMEQMNLANLYYDGIYRKYQNKPNIKKFNICMEKFNQIKSLIESKKVSSPRIDKLYLEAWISTLYSNKHALNLEPETEEQLNILSQKIQAIGNELQKLLIKNSSLGSSDNSSRLLKYINNFKHSWKIDEKKLLADATFNFAESLVEQSSFQQAFYQFDQARNLYKKAAHATDSNNDYKQLLEFSKQKEERLNVIKRGIKTPALEDYSNTLKDLSIRLQRIPNSSLEWTIVDESLPAQSTQSIQQKQAIEVKDFNEKTDLSLKVKRQSNEECTYPETKKPKKDPSIHYPKKIKFRWNIECEQLLKKLNEITIENYKLSSSSPSQHELNRFKGSLASQTAIHVIEKLVFINKKLDDNDPIILDYLKKAKSAFQNSISFYNRSGLIREKGKIIQCHTMIIDTIKAFDSINLEKFPIKSKIISRTNKVSLFKPRPVDLHVYQDTLSERRLSVLLKGL